MITVFKCDECGHVFEEHESDTYKELHSEVGCYEEFMCCPSCGSIDLIEVDEEELECW